MIDTNVMQYIFIVQTGTYYSNYNNYNIKM